jgi:hypothetical protein
MAVMTAINAVLAAAGFRWLAAMAATRRLPPSTSLISVAEGSSQTTQGERRIRC